VIERHHDNHFFEKLLEFSLVKLRFLHSFSGSVQSSVTGLDFVYTAKSSAPDFFNDCIILKVIEFFHFNKFVPLDLDFFNILQVLDCLGDGFLLVVFNNPILSLMDFIVNLRSGGIDMRNGLLFESMMEIEVMI
jgi:hypothetical protein